nr:hypothetical protein [uncultured Pedobacter sp.]
MKDKIAEILGVNEKIIEEVNYYYTENREKVDEITIIHVEDYNIAEKMILKVDALDVNSNTNLMLEVISDQYLKIQDTLFEIESTTNYDVEYLLKALDVLSEYGEE